jgi:hypothetical protein
MAYGRKAALPCLRHFGQGDIELALSAARRHSLPVTPVSRLLRWLRPAVLLGAGALTVAAAPAADYAIVVSRATQADRDWRRVVEVLHEKHQGAVIVFDASVEEALPKLRDLFPRYACFVARPGEVSRRFVAQVHRLTCKLDDNPYPDCFWGILTGYDAANALRLAEHQEPLTVRKVVAGTEIPFDMCEEGRWYSELEAGHWTRKEKGGEPEALSGASDTTEALVNALTEYRADLFVTSGHATERDWQIGYRYRNGQFRCENGLLYDRDTLAFYGDPAWVARMADRPKAWNQTLTETNGSWTFQISPNRGERTFKPINLNGSQRGGRPIIQFHPSRLKDVRVIEGADLNPVITDTFILVPNPRECDPARNYRVVFRAKTR